MTATATTTEKKDVLRDKRAQGIAAMGLVKREGDRFRVTTPTLRGRRSSYEVWRDEAGKVRCSCLEYEEHAVENTAFRCEHILAVKHALVNKNSETIVKQAETAKQSEVVNQPEAVSKPVAVPAEKDSQLEPTTTVTPNVTTRASEKFDAAQSEDAHVAPAAEPLSFEREQINVTDSISKLNLVESQTNNPLGAHEDNQEHPMKRQMKEETIAFENAHDEHKAPVVPLAFANTLRNLRQPIDAKLVKSREGWTDRSGNLHMVEYVEWHTVADLLDRLTPTWSHSVRNIVQIGETVAVTAAITIDGVTREGVGTGTADNETGIKKAEHDALKRAAIKFGIARDLYQRESEVIEKQGSGPQAGEFPRDPLAKSMADLVTPKQLGMIRALGREVNVDIDEECQAVLRCKTDELSKRAASSFIEHLKGLQQEAAANNPMRRAS